MDYTEHDRKVLEGLERRKLAKDDPCDSCYGTGASSDDSSSAPLACGHCLGQGILLTHAEWKVLTGVAIEHPADNILNAQILE